MSVNNDQFLSLLIEDMKTPVILFLGAGSSQEGVKEGGEIFPSFNQMQKDIIEEFGGELREKITGANSQELFEMFLKVESSLSECDLVNRVVRGYLQGRPGHAHFQLAALIFAEGGNLFLTLTPNYDNLLRQSMFRLTDIAGMQFEPYALQDNSNILTNNIITSAREFPVLLKLFGDLGAHKCLFNIEDLNKRIRSNHKALKHALANPLLFIGYSFTDELYRGLLVEPGGTVYIVNPDTVNPETQRKCLQFKGTFSQFMRELLEKLENKKYGLHEKVYDFLRQVDPETKFQRFDEVMPLLTAISERGKGAVEERFQIQSGGRNNREFLIERKEAATWVNGFLASTSPLMLLLGESGLGKSCFLYETANMSTDQVITSFFAGANLAGEAGVFGKICQELSTDIKYVKRLFVHLDKLLKQADPGKQWLIVIDGLNESPNFKILFEQILDISGWNLKQIKIIYSCRTVFWDNQRLANEQIEKKHYSGWSCRIENFTLEETEAAYRNYQALLDIPTPYTEVHPQVQKHMANPLMMRMIVQTYQGKRLLEYIPATTVFDNYWEHLCEKSSPQGSPLNMGVLKLLAKRKIDDANISAINSSDQFFLDDFLNDPRVTEEAIVAWQDEGVLAWLDVKNQSFRFSFDRFYEFVLSKILVGEYRNQGQPEPIFWILKKYRQFETSRAHFSYREALKSLLVRFGLEKRSLDLKVLMRLIPELEDRIFAQQCLRELLFETEQPVIDAFEEIIAQSNVEDADTYIEAQLTLSANSPKVIRSALNGLFSGDERLAQRCIQLLLSLDMKYKDLVRQRGREILAETPELDEPHCKGLIYLYVLYFCWNYRDRDPVESLAEASSDYMDLVIRFPAYHVRLAKQLSELIRRKGPYLFSTNSQGGDDPLNYPWERMGEPERQLALQVGIAVGKEFEDLTEKDFEAIRFFSMELPKVELMNKPRSSDIAQEYPFESKLGQWTFIRHGKKHFAKIIQVLDGFMQKKDSCTSDFCICLLYEIITQHFQPNEQGYKLGYEQLQRWVDYFCVHDEEGFFSVLQSEDIYNDTNNPLEETAYIYADLNPRVASNHFLDKWITSDDLRRKKLGLLAVRRMWKKTGIQALNSARGLFLSQDRDIQSWLNRLMKEVSLLDRRLYEQYLSNLSLSASRLQEIENTESALAHTDNLRSSALIKMFFSHGIGRIRLLQDWHRKICESSSLDDYLCQITSELIEHQEWEYSNRQSAFCDQ